MQRYWSRFCSKAIPSSNRNNRSNLQFKVTNHYHPSRECSYLELVLNFAYYENHTYYEDFRLVSPDLFEASRMWAIDGKFSSIFTVHGLSSVINHVIVSVYLSMNGMLDNCMHIFNTVISPRRYTLKHGCGLE